MKKLSIIFALSLIFCVSTFAMNPYLLRITRIRNESEIPANMFAQLTEHTYKASTILPSNQEKDYEKYPEINPALPLTTHQLHITTRCGSFKIRLENDKGLSLCKMYSRSLDEPRCIPGLQSCDGEILIDEEGSVDVLISLPVRLGLRDRRDTSTTTSLTPAYIFSNVRSDSDLKEREKEFLDYWRWNWLPQARKKALMRHSDTYAAAVCRVLNTAAEAYLDPDKRNSPLKHDELDAVHSVSLRFFVDTVRNMTLARERVYV